MRRGCRPRDREPESGPASLGREERREDRLLASLRDTRPGVPNDQADPTSAALAPDRERTAAAHGLTGVPEQVYQNLRHEPPIDGPDRAPRADALGPNRRQRNGKEKLMNYLMKGFKNLMKINGKNIMTNSK